MSNAQLTKWQRVLRFHKEFRPGKWYSKLGSPWLW